MQPETSPTPTYSDGLILLIGYTADDIEDHLAGEDEETARQFRWWPKHSTRESVQRAFSDWADNWRDQGPVHTFAVRDNATGTLLGGCQLRKQPDGSAEVSYWTGAPYRGRGLAQRAVRLLCLHARSEAVTHLAAHISVDNPASQAVATAVGFTRQGRLHDEGHLVIRYVLDLSSPHGT